MPIEIKELHIKINVDEKPQGSDQKKGKKDQNEAIIAACVEQVMDIISQKQER